MISAQAMAARAAKHAISGASASVSFGPNVQMNTDSDPPLPQNETAVAISPANPKVAVAAANDYVSGGNVVMRTADGGRHWQTTRITPFFLGPATCATVATRRSPTAGGTRSTCASCASSAPCRTPRCRSTSRVTTVAPGRPGARPRARRPTRLRHGHRRRVSLQRQGVHRGRQHPVEPALRPPLRRLREVPHAADGFSDYYQMQLSYTDVVLADPLLTAFHTPPSSPTTPAATAPAGRQTSSSHRRSRRTAPSTWPS